MTGWPPKHRLRGPINKHSTFKGKHSL